MALPTFQAVPHPPDVAEVLYRIDYQSEMVVFPTPRLLEVALDNNDTSYTFTLTSLRPGTKYNVQVRLEARYKECRSFFGGNYSDPIIVQTNNTCKGSATIFVNI